MSRAFLITFFLVLLFNAGCPGTGVKETVVTNFFTESSPSGLFILLQPGADKAAAEMFLQEMLVPESLSFYGVSDFTQRQGTTVLKNNTQVYGFRNIPVFVSEMEGYSLYGYDVSRARFVPVELANARLYTFNFTVLQLYQGKDIIQPARYALYEAIRSSGLTAGKVILYEMVYRQNGRFSAKVGITGP